MDLSGGEVDNNLGINGEFRVAGLLRCQTPEGFLNVGTLRLTGGTIDGGPLEGFTNSGLARLSAGALLGRVVNTNYMWLDGFIDVGTTAGALGVLLSVPGATFEMGNVALRMRNLGSTFWNSGLLFRTGPGQSTISGGAFRNDGRVEVRGGNLNITSFMPQIQDGVLSGGQWIVYPGASLTIPWTVTAVEEGTVVVGGNTATPWLPPVTEVRGAEIEAVEDLGFEGTLLLFFGLPPNVAAAILRIGPGADVTVPGGIQNGTEESILDEVQQALVIARGVQPRLITPALNNYARLVPGGHGEPGPFNLVGNLSMRPSGRILVELGGVVPITEHDRFVITGSAALAGTLDLSLIDEFVPAVGQQFTVLTASGGITGTFASLVPPAGAPAGLVFEAIYTPTSVVVQVSGSCYPNCDGSTLAPVLNVGDFTCFLQRYAAGSPYANCDASSVPPVLNVGDFTCFLQRFGTGCG
jgi:hypothetical protein